MNPALRKELSWLALGTGVVCWALGRRRAGLAFGALATGLATRSSDRLEYAERSVVITGGSRGLGLALAREALARGAYVTLLARDEVELELAREKLSPFGPARVHAIPCDVTDNARVAEALDSVRATFGGVDVWINNAGAITVGPFESMDERDFEAQLNLHLRAVIGITQRLVPYFRERGGGRIVNVSSIGGLIGVPHLSAYSATKHALAGFTKSVSAELAGANIVCTTVYPGLMGTGSPVQAVFKGDHAREFAWFAAADTLPGLSMNVTAAARRILDAAADGASEVTVGLPAHAARLLHATLPETFHATLKFANRLLPARQSHVRRTGADVRALEGGEGPWRKIAERLEREWNQGRRPAAERGLGSS